MFDMIQRVLKLKWFEVFQLSYYMSNLKLRSWTKKEIKGHNLFHYNQFMDYQNWYKFFKRNFNVISPYWFSVFKAHL